jgi:hypothetical protein
MVRIVLLLLTLLLTACVSPMRMGISEAEWRHFSPEEKEKIKKGYYEVLKGRFHANEKAVSDGSTLNVKIAGGQISMPPFNGLCHYAPLEFNILSGDCLKLDLKELEGNRTIPMQACYRNKTLFLDPSRYDPTKRIGSIQLHYSPIWDRGFTYANVSSSGYAHLTNVNVSVKRYQDNEPAGSSD